MVNYDSVLTQVGGFGISQKLLGFMVGYTGILCGFNEMSIVFINYTPDYRCRFPPIDDPKLNYTEAQILNMTTPTKTNGDYDYCMRYVYDDPCTSTNIMDCIDTTKPPIKCDHGFHYNRNMFDETVITEFDLVCDKAGLDGLATALYMVGVLIGSIMFGMISDKFGRKTVLISTTFVSFACSMGSAFTYNYTWFVVTRVLCATFGFGIYLSSFVYLTEICEKKHRSALGIWYQATYSIGYMILSGVAYNWRNWHQMVFVLALFYLPFLLVVFFIPESPRWLFSVGKEEQAKKISRKLAKYNGNQLSEPGIWVEAANTKAEEEPDFDFSTILDLFRTRPMRRMIFRSMFLWFVNSMVYFGIALNADSLEGSLFINNTIYGAVEIASYIFLVCFLERTGRRWMLIMTLAISGTGLIVNIICTTIGEDNEGVQTTALIFSFVSKFGIAAAYAVIYNLTSELFPTVVRTTAVGVSSLIGNIGSVIAPLLMGLEEDYPWLPNTINGVLAVIGAIVSLSLPETTGIDMMETIEEAERFYRGEKPQLSSQANLAYKIDTVQEDEL